MGRLAQSTAERNAKSDLAGLTPQERALKMKYRFQNIRTYYISKRKAFKKPYYDKQYAFFKSYPEGLEYAKKIKEHYDNQPEALEPVEEIQYKGKGGRKAGRSKGKSMEYLDRHDFQFKPSDIAYFKPPSGKTPNREEYLAEQDRLKEMDEEDEDINLDGVPDNALEDMADLPDFEEPVPGMSDEEGQEKFNKRKKKMKKDIKSLSENVMYIRQSAERMNNTIDNLFEYLWI